MSDCVQVNLRITTNSNQGGRKYMEDTYAIALQRLNPSDKESPISLAYFGIFDGHGGKEAAEFARQHLCQHILEQDDFWIENGDDRKILSAIRQGFLSCHNDMWNHVDKWSKTSSGLPSTSGCTASVVFIRGNKLYIGHVGDSSIVIGEGESLHNCWKANRITRDHKPEDPSELKRIRESGGNVLCKAGVHRVVWNRQKIFTSNSYSRHEQTKTTIEYEQIPFLAVSRALGDLWSLNNQTNLYSVSPEPELTVIEIDPNRHRCIVLASDGLWNMITPEAAVEIVRNCDVKTEEMILKSDDDEERPFRNPSHELVQKAMVYWRQRMLRADNITCITVMLDPPGPPFSECILNKKKQINSSSISSTSNSSDMTVEQTSNTTPQRPKIISSTKEQILLPISNGSTSVRTPKRSVSDENLESIGETPKRKLIKTTKENVKTSNDDEEAEGPEQQQDLEEYLPLTEQTAKMSTKDKIEEEIGRNSDRSTESDIDLFDGKNSKSKSSTLNRRRRSRFRFSFSNQSAIDDSSSMENDDQQDDCSRRKSRLGRTLSASIIQQEKENLSQMKCSRRRKSYSSTGLANDLKQMTENAPLTNQIDQKSSKIKSSLATRVKRAFFRPHRSNVATSN